MTTRRLWQNRMALTLILFLVVGVAEGGPRLPAWQHADTAPAPLPPGYALYVSKTLPYSIGYPQGWQAEGSIFGSVARPTGIYYDADIFYRKGVGTIVIQSEGLPPGSLLTSLSYRELEVLDLQRAREEKTVRAYTATRGEAIPVDGTQAYLLDTTRQDSSGTTPSTQVIWVARGRAWKAGFVLIPHVPQARRDALLTILKTMLRFFHQR